MKYEFGNVCEHVRVDEHEESRVYALVYYSIHV